MNTMVNSRKGRRKRSKGNSDSDDRQNKKFNASETAMDETAVFSVSNEPSEQPAEFSSQEPPSAQQMWKLLKRIEINTTALLEENRQLRKSLEFTQTEVQELKSCNALLTTRIEALEAREKVADKTIHDLEEKYDDIEQYSRKFNLEIHGIPERKEEDIAQIILDLAEAIDADVREEDIDICHRLYKAEGKARPIIVKFTNYDSKYEMYSKRLRLRKVDNREKFGVERVFINENLTSRRALLYSKVRKKVKDNSVWNTWTMDGKIFLRKSPTGRPIRIKAEDDINKQ